MKLARAAGAAHPEVTRAGAMTRRPRTTHTVPFLPLRSYLSLVTTSRAAGSKGGNVRAATFVPRVHEAATRRRAP